MPNVTDPNYYCVSCDRRFTFLGSFRNHLKRLHNFVKIIVPEAIIVNRRMIHNFLCQLCRMTFNNRETYRDHLVQAHNKILAPHSSLLEFICGDCQISFKSIRKVHSHVYQKKIVKAVVKDRYNQNREIKVKCQVCDRVFEGLYKLGIHKEDEHRVHFIYDNETLHCNLCDSSLYDLKDYRDCLVDVHLIDQLSVKNTLEAVKNKERFNYPLHRYPFDLSNVKKTEYTILGLSDPSNKYCRVCDIEYNSTIHYQLHCFKFHEVGV